MHLARETADARFHAVYVRPKQTFGNAIFFSSLREGLDKILEMFKVLFRVSFR